MCIGDVLEKPKTYSLEKLSKSTNLNLFTLEHSRSMKVTQGKKIKVHPDKIQEHFITASDLKEMHANHDALVTTKNLYGMIGNNST
jgi:hypothetical protein